MRSFIKNQKILFKMSYKINFWTIMAIIIFLMMLFMLLISNIREEKALLAIYFLCFFPICISINIIYELPHKVFASNPSAKNLYARDIVVFFMSSLVLFFGVWFCCLIISSSILHRNFPTQMFCNQCVYGILIYVVCFIVFQISLKTRANCMLLLVFFMPSQIWFPKTLKNTIEAGNFLPSFILNTFLGVSITFIVSFAVCLVFSLITYRIPNKIHPNLSFNPNNTKRHQ